MGFEVLVVLVVLIPVVFAEDVYYICNLIKIDGYKITNNMNLIHTRTYPRVVYTIDVFTGVNMYHLDPSPPPSGDEGSGGGNGGAQPPSGDGSSSWDPVPWWAREWTSKNVRDYIRYPFRILVEMVGLPLLSAVVYGVIMFATFMHTKSAFATGVVSMIMATAMIMVLPELVWISYIALAFGIAAVIYEVAKKVV